MTENIIVIAFFIGLSVFFYFIQDFFSQGTEESSAQLDRLKAYVEKSVQDHEAQRLVDDANWGKEKEEEANTSDPFAIETPKGSPLLKNLGLIVEKFTPKKFMEDRQKSLVRADIPLKANEFVSLQLFIGCIVSVIARLLSGNPLFMIPGFFVGGFIPMLGITLAAKRRQSAFQNQILDTLLMTANGLKAGYSFLQSMELVCKEGSPPMQRELGKVIRENGLGIGLEDTMLAMNERVQSADWDLVTTVILIQRQIGGNLAEILDKIAATIRVRLQIQGDISAKTAQGRASGFIVGGLPFGIGIMIFQSNPNYISKLWTFENGRFKGWYVTVAALVWECIGIWVILKIVDIDV